MTSPAHTDMVAYFGGDLDVLYNQLLIDQERDLFTHKLATWCLYGLSGLACAGLMNHWEITAIFGYAAVISLERSLWWGRELSNRNQLMHVVTMERARKRHAS